MARILISGAAGFIGHHMVAAGLAAGDEVHALVRPGRAPERLARFRGRIACHPVDLGSAAALAGLMAEVAPDVVYHLAASPRRKALPSLADAADSVRDDVVSLINMASAAAVAPRPPAVFIRTGSLAEYGSALAPYVEGVREEPTSVYAAALVAATQYASALQPRLPFPIHTARLALVHGPGQSLDYLVPTLIRNCLEGAPTRLAHPDDRRDLMHVDDAVAGLRRLAAARLPSGTIVNLSTGVAPTVAAIAAEVAALTGAAPGLIEMPDPTARSALWNFWGAPDRALDLIGWKAVVAMRQGLARTVAWYRDRASEERLARAAGETA
jgi:nucleoside-diphosphate-sugar epimerase